MAMMDDNTPIFIDTNVLIRANVATAPAHEQSLKAIQKLRHRHIELWISRQMLREYIATVTREQTFMKPLPAVTVVERARYFQSHFRVAEDSASVTEHLLELLEKIPVGGKQVHDCNIVATMQSYGLRYLLTFNPADFVRFSAHITILSVEDVEGWN